MKITAENYEQWALDYLEGTLPNAERDAFERFLATDARAAEQIRLLGEYMPVARTETVPFPDPASLMRGRGVTPLRRLFSLASGAAAAALIAGIFMFLGRPSSPQTALNHRSQGDTVPAAEIVLAHNELTETAPAKPEPEAKPVRETPAAVAARTYPAGSSRLAQWNRKTAERLERMEARERQRHERTRLTADAARSETRPEAAQPHAPAETGNLLASSALPERKAAVVTDRTAEGSRAARENALPGSLSLLPPDATTPILGVSEESSYLREEYRTRESWLSEETRPRREGGLLRSLLSPIEKISPIKYYETEEGRGVEIASILRIGSRNN